MLDIRGGCFHFGVRLLPGSSGRFVSSASCIHLRQQHYSQIMRRADRRLESSCGGADVLVCQRGSERFEERASGQGLKLRSFHPSCAMAGRPLKVFD